MPENPSFKVTRVCFGKPWHNLYAISDQRPQGVKNSFDLSQGFLSGGLLSFISDIGGITRHDAWKRGTGRVITFLNVFSILTVNYKGLRSALRAGSLLCALQRSAGRVCCWPDQLAVCLTGVWHITTKSLTVKQATAEVSPTPIFYSVFIFLNPLEYF